MAIQIRSIGVNKDIVSLSLSASVSDSPAKLSVTTLGDRGFNRSNIRGISGIEFIGQLISYSTHKEQGKFLTTYEYIDDSVTLDQKCIVLFRRGLGGRPINVAKTISVPVVNASYDRGRVSFDFGIKNLNIVVQRQAGYSAGGLGQEEWSSNPCDSSNVTYNANQALAIIGAPKISENLRCSYEGTYRSVLGSIYSDAGIGWWWDWRKNKIVPIKDGSIKFSVPQDGCGILSLDYGATRDGVSSQSSWFFERWPTKQTQEAALNVTDNRHVSISPTLHPNFPTDNEVLEKVCPPLSIHNALTNGDYRKLGYDVLSKIELSLSVTDPKWLNFLSTKFNFDSKNTNFRDAIFKYLNIDGDGDFYLAYPLNNNTQSKEYTQELYYPYDESYDFNDSGGDEFNFKKIQTSFNPPPSQRGKNPYSSTFEDQNNIVRKGYWRSVSEHVSGDVEAADFAQAVEDCIKQVTHDLICQIYDQRSLPAEDAPVTLVAPTTNNEENGGYVPSGERLRKQIEQDGKVIIFVKRPRYNIAIVSESESENPNDLTEVYDYEDPNAILDPVPPQDKPDIVDECADIVPNLINPNRDVVINNGSENSAELSPGLEHARGKSYSINCNGKSIKVVMPSMASFKAIRAIKSEYSVSNQTGYAQAINSWGFSGPINSDYGLSHNVIVTDVTPNENEPFTSFEVPAAIGGNGQKWLSTLSAECDGFFLPIVPGLGSLSASLDSRGLRVSYSYKEIPIRPKPSRLINSSKRNNTSNTFS
jgi:hypothetical protein